MWIESSKAQGSIFYFYVLLCLGDYPINALLYPRSSVIQLVGSISVPVINLPLYERIAFDWGFQMNYDMPFALSSFYNVPIWSLSNDSTIRSARSTGFGNARAHLRDFTIVELYEAIEGILESYGYNESCVKLVICDLMRSPFDMGQGHFICDVLSLFLRPSQHLGIGRLHLKELKGYLLAELRGIMGLDCTGLYADCHENPLSLFSKVSYE